MREAVIVSAARTPIGRAFRGAFNQTPGATLAGHVLKHAMERAAVDPAEIDDVILGCGLAGGRDRKQRRPNLGVARRLSRDRAGPDRQPVLRVGTRCDRRRGAPRNRRRLRRSLPPAASSPSSMVQNEMNLHFFTEEWLLRHAPDLYMPMLYTADFVAKKYDVSRARQDEYALQSQQRTAAAQAAGRFDAEIVPMPSWKYEQDRESGAVVERRVELTKDEGNRPDTTIEGLAALKGAVPGVPDTSVTAGNSSQLSDGAAAVVVMDAEHARRRGLPPLGYLSRLRRRRPPNPAKWASGRSSPFPSYSRSTG